MCEFIEGKIIINEEKKMQPQKKFEATWSQFASKETYTQIIETTKLPSL